MTSEEFNATSAKFQATVAGGKINFKGIMSEFGYSASSTKTQIAIVKSADIETAALTDADIVGTVKNSVAIQAVVKLNETSIALPTSVEGFDATISWASNNTAIIANDGTVTHPAKDTNVSLTATISSNSYSETKDFTVLVYGSESTYTEVASLDLEDASLENSYGCSATKSSYAEGTIKLGTPSYNWLLRNALIGGSDADNRNGIYSIRMQSNTDPAATGRIEIKENLEINAVQFNAALYGSNAPIKVSVEYSTDNGSTWISTNVVLDITTAAINEYRILLPETADRVAIYAVAGTGQRVNIDDISLLK